MIDLRLNRENLISAFRSTSFAIFLCLIVISVFWSPLSRLARISSLDNFYKLRHFYNKTFAKEKLMPKGIVFVAVDETSYYRLKMSRPWSREFFANLLDKLNGYGPKVIALDINLFGKNGISWGGPEMDKKFADTIKRCGNVILLAFYGKEEGERLYFGPENIFAAASAGYGATGAVRDPDGVIRRLKISSLVYHDKTPINVSFEIKTALSYMGVPYGAYTKDSHNAIFKSKDEYINLPVDNHGRMLINYVSGFKDLKTVSLWKVLEGDIPAGIFKDKLILVGDTGKSFHDVHRTPFGRQPGGAIIANVLNSMITDSTLREVRDQVTLPVIILIYLISFVMFFKGIEDEPSKGLVNGLLVLVSIPPIYFLATFIAFLNNIVWPLFDVMVVLPVLCVTMMLYNYAVLFLNNAELNMQTRMDFLTRLFTHRRFYFLINQVIKRAKLFRARHSLIILEVINLERIIKKTDFKGGESIQQRMADLIRANLPKKSSAARLGLGEFGVFIPDTGMNRALTIAGGLKDNIKKADFGISEEYFKPVVAVGVSSIDVKGFPKTAAELIGSARVALKRAKEIGPNEVCRFNPDINGSRVEHDTMAKEIDENAHDEFSFRKKDIQTKDKEIEELVRQHLEDKEAIVRAYIEAVGLIITHMEGKDPATAGHSERAAEWAEKIGIELKMHEEEIGYLKQAVAVHDLGKFEIPTKILRKQGPLTEYEKDIISLHPEIGVKILEKSEYYRKLLPTIRYHQERLDGSGYPKGLKGNQIPFGAQVAAVADVFESLTALDRPYRTGTTPEQALNEELLSHHEKYNQKIVLALKRVLEREGKL